MAHSKPLSSGRLIVFLAIGLLTMPAALKKLMEIRKKYNLPVKCS